MPKLIHNAVALSKSMMKEMAGDVIVAADLTLGNGQDTLFLLDHFPHLQLLLGMDVQEDALIKTRAMIQDHPNAHVAELICQGHEHIASFVPNNQTLDLVLYNLGYLPGVNKHITTMTNTTLQSLNAVLPLLTPKGGLMSVVCYPGHEEGAREYEALQAFLGTLNQKQYNVIHSKFINQVNHPPVSILIQKR